MPARKRRPKGLRELSFALLLVVFKSNHGSEGVKTDSDESHFNVSLIVRDEVTRQCPQTTTFLMRKESRSGIEPRPLGPSAYQPNALPLGQTGSLGSRVVLSGALWGAGIAQWLERRARDRKVAGSNP